MSDASQILSLNVDEQDRLLTHLEEGHLNSLFCICFYLETGCRNQEATPLTIGDLRNAMRLEKPYLTVRTVKQKTTKPSYRKIPIRKSQVHPNHHYSLFDICLRILKFREKDADNRMMMANTGGFMTRAGSLDKPITKQGMLFFVKNQVKKIGRPDCNVHTLRHTFAFNRLRDGMSLPVLQRLLGHKSLASTSAYVQPSLDDIFEQMG